MKFIDAAADHYRSIFCVLALIIIGGLYARNHMTVEASPNIAVPIAIVSVFHDGISPEDGARLIARPLEKELRSLEGIDEIVATARESIVYMVVRFEAEEDVEQAIRNTREAVDRGRAELPQGAEEPVIKEISANSQPTIVVTLSGGQVPERDLFNTARQLQNMIEAEPEVLEANMVGHREEVVEVIIDPERLEYYRVTSDELIRAVLDNNLLVPAGVLDSGGGRFSVKVPGLLESRADIYGMPIKHTLEGVVSLGQLAEVRRTFKDPEGFTLVNGRRAITVEVKKRNQANSTMVAERVRALVGDMDERIPRGVEVGYVMDQSSFTRTMVSEMQGNVVTAMALVMMVVVAALGLRSGILVGLGIPFSLLFAAIITYSIGFSFNFMVMFGMLLALGMLIDGAIVITEFGDRKMAEGMSARAAYQVAVKRMLWPVAASTATTLAAFLPIMFWPGVAGEFMSFLPITVFAVLMGSLLYALLFLPVVGGMFGRSRMEPETQRYLRALETDDPLSLKGFTGFYARLLRRLLAGPIKVWLSSLLILVAIFMLYGRFNAGVIFFAETEEKYGSVSVRAQGNLSVSDQRQLVSEVEDLVLQVPGVEVTYAAGGQGSDSHQSSRQPAKDQVGVILVELGDPQYLADSTRELFRQIREKVAQVAGIKTEASLFEGGPPVGKPVQVELSSLNRGKLIAATDYLTEYLSANFDGLINIENTLSLPGIDWELEVDRGLAAQLGANVVEVGRAVQLVTNGVKVGEYRPNDADDELDIRLRFPEHERGLNALDSLRVNTREGAVPISSFVERRAQPKLDSIQRVDGREVMTVRADVADGVLADDKVREIQAWLAESPLDPAVNVRFRGANEEQEKSMAFLSAAFSLALFLMFVLLVTQFNSFYQALLILSGVVMSTAGVLLGLVLTKSTFSIILTGVGIVALAGIVVNNNIVLIDTYNHLRALHRDLTPVEAAIMAAVQRLRPVFLTTVTTILGLLPIAMDVSVDLIGRSVVMGGVVSSNWVPLASAIVYGLAFSTLLTLILTPAMLVLPRRFATMFECAVKPRFLYCVGLLGWRR